MLKAAIKRASRNIQVVVVMTILFLGLAVQSQPVDITGTVKNEFGAPVARAVVWLVLAGYSDTTDTDGKYLLKGTAIGTTVNREDRVRPFLNKNGLHFSISTDRQTVRVDIFDVRGRSVLRALDKSYERGTHCVRLPLNTLSSEVFLVRVKMYDEVLFFKYVLLNNKRLPAAPGDLWIQEPQPSASVLNQPDGDTLRVSAVTFPYAEKAVTSLTGEHNFTLSGLCSPDKKVIVLIVKDTSGILRYSVKRSGVQVITPSALGITINNNNLGPNATFISESRKVVDEKYPWRGVKSEVRNNYCSRELNLRNSASSTDWKIEARAYNDGIAFRYIVPGQGTRTINNETTEWILPSGCMVWHRENIPQYEHDDYRKSAKDIQSGLNIQIPVTLELQPGNGYAAIAEGGEFEYSGLSLQATGTDKLTAYYKDDSNGWSATGEIRSPWRIIMTGPSLHELVNCDIVHSVCPPPDSALFPDGINTAWVKPGRSLWTWWAYNDAGTQWSNQKQFVDNAALLNCHYFLVDAGWENSSYGWVQNGTSWARLKELCDYAAPKGIGIWVWRSWYDCGQGPGLETAQKQTEFFLGCKNAGAKGVKIDYLGSEGIARRKFVTDILKQAAQNQIMVNFHGCPKPTGECRTWPNEMTREGIKGLEHNKWGTISAAHYSTIPFTRLLAGHGDFTPTTLQSSMTKGTTFSLQLATAIVYTSPVLCWADKADVYLNSSCVAVIKQIPPTWDETIVLPGSEIGKVAAFARRKGTAWYVGVINGDSQNQKSFDIVFSFLAQGQYTAVYCSDVLTSSTAMQIKKDILVKKDDKLNVTLQKAGGFVAQIIPVVRKQ